MATTREDSCGKAIAATLAEIREAGTYKAERVIVSPQGTQIRVQGSDQPVLCFCANNYLGLCDHPELIEACKAYAGSHGFGMSSVRFICGTQDIHKELEAKITAFHRTQDTILFSSCFDANGGVFEAFLTAQDAIISDRLNHASIIDGIRLCKAQRWLYQHRDMADLEKALKEATEKGCRVKCVATDGVFSMDGTIAPLREICDLAERYDAIVLVDESHACGFLGEGGRGAVELCGCMDRVAIITSTLGKALGGASGGYVTGRSDVIEILRQRARPYLFSNTLAPPLTGAYLKVFEILSTSTALKKKLEENTTYFRQKMAAAGFTLRGDDIAPIVPVMLGDARVATRFADEMLKKGIYVIGFSYPVVPKGEARIRTQLSAAHTREELDQAIAAFIEVGKELGVIQ